MKLIETKTEIDIKEEKSIEAPAIYGNKKEHKYLFGDILIVLLCILIPAIACYLFFH